MTAGLNSRPKEWSRPPEPHPPDAGCWCSRNQRRPYVSLIWCSTPSGHGNGLKPWIRNNDRRAAHEPVNLPLDCKHAHVSGHSPGTSNRLESDPKAVVAQNRQIPRPCPAIRERTSQNLRSRGDPGHGESMRRKNESALTIFGLDDLSEVRRQRTFCRIVQIAGEGGKAGRASEER